MSEMKSLAHNVLDELWAIKEKSPFHPTEDIDMVWVLSAPGTVKEMPNAAPYEGTLFDLNLVKGGVEIVKEVTALRLNKKPKDVNKTDIEKHGPVFFYNGEDKNTKNVNYLQNEHLAELVSEPDFELPKSKIVIDRIDEISTVPQVKGLAKYLKNFRRLPRKIAVVSGYQHSSRVGRYLQHYQYLFPDSIEFVNAPVEQLQNESAIAGHEARKILKYYKWGI